MAMMQKEYSLRPGRGVQRNPGILSVENMGEFTAHECSEDCSTWTYVYKYRLTPKVKCTAKTKLVYIEDKWILQDSNSIHKCEPNRAKVIAELLRHEMKDS